MLTSLSLQSASSALILMLGSRLGVRAACLRSSIHLLLFAPLTILLSKQKAADAEGNPVTDIHRINWRFVRFALTIMFIPKLAGVIGLIVLPTDLMNSIIFLLIAGYSMTYILGRPLQSSSQTLDIVFLIIGAYISGTSLVGGPMVIAVALRHIKPYEFRDTLFVIWTVLVSIKSRSCFISAALRSYRSLYWLGCP